jgi:hypothetical protein
MNVLITWAEFLGAWLLVAGPLYQGSVELDELDMDRAAFEGIKASAIQAAQDQRPSAWWWLLPPVMYVLRRRWARAFREATTAQLTDAQREQLTAFRSKATGWFTVAAGATLLAAGETWQLTEHYRWPLWVFWLLLVVMSGASVLYTASQMIGAQHARRAVGAGSAPAAQQL